MRVLSSAAAAGFVAVSLGAQSTPAENHPGTVSVAAGDAQVAALIRSQPQRRAALAAAETLLAIVRRDPAIGKPVGFRVGLSPMAGVTQVRYPGDELKPLPGAPPYFGVTATLSKYAMSDGALVDDGGRWQLFVVANAVGSGTGDLLDVAPALDGGPPVFDDLKQTGEFRGRPLYNGACTYVTHRSEPPLRPLTRERFLKLQILRIRRDSMRHAGEARTRNPSATGVDQSTLDAINEMRKLNPAMADSMQKIVAAANAAMNAHASTMDSSLAASSSAGAAHLGEELRTLQSQLDGLSAAERAQPAFGSLNDWSPKPDPDAPPLMEINTSFYDKSLGSGVAQLIWVCIPHMDGTPDQGYQSRAEGSAGRARDKAEAERDARDAVRIRDGLDWSALERLVRP